MDPILYPYVFAGLVVVMSVVIFVKKAIDTKKSGSDVDFKAYLDQFSDKIIVVAEQVIGILDLKQSDYVSENAFKDAVVDHTIDSIIEVADELNIDTHMLMAISKDYMRIIIREIIDNKLPELMGKPKPPVTIEPTKEEAKSTDNKPLPEWTGEPTQTAVRTAGPGMSVSDNTSSMSSAIHNFYSEGGTSEEV